MTKDEIFELIRTELTKSGMTKAEFCRQTEIAQQDLNYYLKGERNPTLSRLEKMLKVLKLEIDIINEKE